MDKLPTLESIERKFGLTNINRNSHRVPNFLYDIPLSKNEKLVLNYFCRRSNRDGICFVSQERICKDLGIKSPKTVRPAIKKLVEIGFVQIFNDELQDDRANKKTSTTYKVCGGILEVVLYGNSNSGRKGKFLPNRGVKNTHNNGENLPTERVNITHNYEQNLPTKEVVKEKENNYKESITNLRKYGLERIVDEYMNTLTHDEQWHLEHRALHQREFGCPSPKRKSKEWYRLIHECMLEEQGDL